SNPNPDEPTILRSYLHSALKRTSRPSASSSLWRRRRAPLAQAAWPTPSSSPTSSSRCTPSPPPPSPCPSLSVFFPVFAFTVSFLSSYWLRAEPSLGAAVGG